MNLQNRIFELLLNEKSIFLIGPTDSGKSWFAEKILLPFLYDNGLTGAYTSVCEMAPNFQPKGDFIIIDEVESLQDRRFLENLHSEEKPYYKPEYLAKIQKWNDQLKKINIPSVYIVTRNGKSEIDNFIKNVSTTDWDDRKVECIEFRKTDRIIVSSCRRGGSSLLIQSNKC